MKAIIIGAWPAWNIGGNVRGLLGRSWEIDAPSAMELDVSDPLAFADFAVTRGWQADALVYAAGYCEPNWIWEANAFDLANEVNVNLTGALLAVRSFTGANREDAEGWETYRKRIVIIGSRAAETPHRGQSAYNAAKAGLRAAVTTLARELHPQGFRVFLIEPGAVDGTAYGDRVAAGARRMGLDDRAGAVRGTFGQNLTAVEVARLAADLVNGRYDWMAGAPIPYGGGPQL